MGAIATEAHFRATGEEIVISKWWFGLGCFIIYVPLCLVRKVEKLAVTHLFGDIMIIITVVVIFAYAGMAVKENGGFSTEGMKPI